MMNLFEMSAILKLDSSEFEANVNDAENKTSSLSASTVAMGKIMADAFETVISKVAEYGQKIVDVGLEQETALAKVNTIMDTSKMSTEEMSSAIRDLSSEMGVSTAELSDTVYNAISATGDTANAVALAGQASKLATAGFTDTSSALSTLTTAMNAYGLTAEDTEHISDSLITVQNLGVTTVGELASSMGKGIASASAYGVNLENLESAYISITKAGINTAEGTTYISSMLKELGDSGSDVAGILQEKTGKAFNEFLADGNSLGDALQILSDSVDGDSTALMNLWSSAEAGKASSAIMGQGIETFNANLETLQTTTGTTETAFDTMSNTMEHRLSVMKERMSNNLATLFEKFEPTLEKLLEFFESDAMPVIEEGIGKLEEFAPVIEENLGTALETVSGIVNDTLIPAFTWIKDNMNVIAPIVATVAGAFAGFMVLETVASLMQGVATAMGILNAVMAMNPFVLVAIAIAGLVAGIITLWNTNEDFRNFITECWEAIKTGVGTVVDAIKTFFTVTIPEAVNTLIAGVEAIPEWFASLPEKIAYAIGSVLGSIRTWIRNMIEEAPKIKDKVIDSIVSFFSNLPSRLWEHLKNAITKFGSFITDLKDKVATGIPELVTNFTTHFKNLPSELGDIGKNVIQGFWNGITEKWEAMVANLKEKIESVKSAFQEGFDTHSPSRWFKWLGEMNTEGFMLGMKDLFNPTGIANQIQNAMNSVGAVSFDNLGGTAGYAGTVYNQTINVNREIATADELARAVRIESRYGLMKGVALE